jgi:PAS domain S-box-containing protein
MQEVIDFFRKLFDAADWPPRWHCGNWTGFHGWLYIISDLLIWSAYFAIPVVILRYVSRRTDAKFVRAYFLFAAFILACGATHLFDAVTFWFPVYRLNALLRFVTGVVSWVTVFYLIRILPLASSLRSYDELEKEVKVRREVEEQLMVTNERLVNAQEIARIGHWEWDIAQNQLAWSAELYKIYGLQPGREPIQYENFINRVHDEDRELVNSRIHESLVKKEFVPFVHRIRLDDGSEKILSARGEVVLNDQGEIIRMLGTGQDITEQQRVAQQLADKSFTLEARNAELQKFAYVASHDLQEPLRKIQTFTSLLEKELGKQDNKAGQYMNKISEAAARMQKLIEDILRFSSLQPSPSDFYDLDLNEQLREVLTDMEVQVSESKAIIEVAPLPSFEGIPSQVRQVFQNLISNAIKFSRDDAAPHVRIWGRVLQIAELKADLGFSDEELSPLTMGLQWESEPFVAVTVTDNGIGFSPVYAEKIFEIFQRLHIKPQGGTGIGLAICRKIMENHHGLIRARGREGEGAEFTLVFPKSQRRHRAATAQ